MTMTEFAMVEELAFLVKDNLSCKHLILSIEEMLVNLLQDNSCSDGILELQPMSPYHRLLLHRLADIFGFAHESVGEGDERHLVLQRCSDSSIPSVLVSDILLQYDEYQCPTTSAHILKREDAWPALKSKEASSLPLMPVEEREAAYLAARERIFSLHHDDDGKERVAPKPRNVPVVARRMIAHALGQRICPTSHSLEASHQNCEEAIGEASMTKKIEGHSDCAAKSTNSTKCSSCQNLEAHERNNKGSRTLESHERTDKGNRSSPAHSSCSEKKAESKPVRNGSGNSSSLRTGSNGRYVSAQSLEREHLGAAKRMFAHALGLASAKSNQSG